MQETTINSPEILRFVFKNKWPVIIITVVAAIASVIVSYMVTPKYKSSVIFFPKAQVAVSQAIESGELIDNSDNILNFGDEEAAEQLIQTLYSEEIRLKVIEKFNLAKHYKIDMGSSFPLTRLQKEFSANIRFKKTEYQAVEVQVMDSDPQMAADIANEISTLLDNTLNNMQNNVAKEILKVVENEYATLVSEIENIELLMGKPGNNPNSPKYISLREQLVNENKRLSLLKAKMAQARLNANQSLPRKFMVTKAMAAEKKSYPVRWLMCTISTVSAFLFAVILLLFINKYKDWLTIKSV